MTIDAQQLVENILGMSDNVNDRELIKEIIRIAQEGNVTDRLTRMFLERGISPADALALLRSGPEDIYLRVHGNMKMPNTINPRDSNRDLVQAMKAKLKGPRRRG